MRRGDVAVSKEQERIRQAYVDHWDSLCSTLKGFSSCRLSQPHLMNIDATNYLGAKPRVMVVGQQTNGWENKRPLAGLDQRDDAIERLLEAYGYFVTHRDATGRNTIFWIYVRRLCKRLFPCYCDPEVLDIAWTNLNKVDRNGGRPTKRIAKKLQEAFPVLRSEIEICQPDVLIFFTGHGFDYLLKQDKYFPNLEKKPVGDPPEAEDQLARIVCDDLPKATSAYRIHHPRGCRYELFDTMLDDIETRGHQ